jgi:hypothetical protein
MIQLLYEATLALHAVFVGYVAAGTIYVAVQAVRRVDDPIAATTRGRLPFMLGCGITAGVAPLLFLQLLHQRRFYTANLLLGPRWLAVVPALVVGFYALYAVKQLPRFRTIAALVGAACFAFVAWSWSELHELSLADTEWMAFYGAGQRTFASAGVAARFVVFAGGMATLFATVASWQPEGTARRLAAIALAGRAASIAGAAWMVARGFDPDVAGAAWPRVLAGAVALDVVAWAAVAWRPGRDNALAAATASGVVVLVAAVVVREAPRLALVEPEHPLATGSAGAPVFVVALVAGAAAIGWVVHVARSVRR